MRSKTTAAVQAVIVLLGIFSAPMVHADCDAFDGTCDIGLNDQSRNENRFFNQQVGFVRPTQTDLAGVRILQSPCLRFRAPFCQVDAIGEEPINMDQAGTVYVRRGGQIVQVARDIEVQLAARYMAVRRDADQTHPEFRVRRFLRNIIRAEGYIPPVNPALATAQALRADPFNTRNASAYGGTPTYPAGGNFNFGPIGVATVQGPPATNHNAGPVTPERQTAPTTPVTKLQEHTKEFEDLLSPSLDQITSREEKHKCYASDKPDVELEMPFKIAKDKDKVTLSLGTREVPLSITNGKTEGALNGGLVTVELRGTDAGGGKVGKYALQILVKNFLGTGVSETLMCETKETPTPATTLNLKAARPRTELVNR